MSLAMRKSYINLSRFFAAKKDVGVTQDEAAAIRRILWHPVRRVIPKVLTVMKRHARGCYNVCYKYMHEVSNESIIQKLHVAVVAGEPLTHLSTFIILSTRSACRTREVIPPRCIANLP